MITLPKFKTSAAQIRYAREAQKQFKDDPVMERHAHSTESRLRQYEKEPTEILYRMLQKGRGTSALPQMYL